MKFVTIPQNGASWSEKLLYTFDTESTEQSDMLFEIVDADSQATIGAVGLRGVISGSFDIAPYIRQRLVGELAQPSLLATMMRSRAAINVVVRCGEVESDARIFFRAAYDPKVIGLLSSGEGRRRMVRRGTIMLTAYAEQTIELTVACVYADKTSTSSIAINTKNRPVDIAYLLTAEHDAAKRIELHLASDNALRQSLTYIIEDRLTTTRQLMWYNMRGGYECGILHTSLRMCDVAEVASTELGGVRYNTLGKAYRTTRLLSAYEDSTEMERIAEMIFSPYIYVVNDRWLEPLDIADRRIEYDKHGALHQASFVISEEWKGGVR